MESKRKPIRKERSRILILNWIFDFSLSIRYGDHIHAGMSGCAFDGMGRAKPGDLVALRSAPTSKYYLSWLVSEKRRGGWDYYLLESVEDNSLMEWYNVALMPYNGETVKDHPQWRWTDRQHEFNDRWARVCRTRRAAHIYLPVIVSYGEGHEVTLGIRTRHALSNLSPRRVFPDWRKVTIKMMLEFYDEAVIETKRHDAEEREKNGAPSIKEPRILVEMFL